MFHDKSKHIEIKYHYIRDMVRRKVVHVQYIYTHTQVANFFTKLLSRMKFEYFHEIFVLAENASLVEREFWWLHLHEIFSRLFSHILSWYDVWESPCDGCVILLSSQLRWCVWTFVFLLWIELRWLEMISSWTHMGLAESTWYRSQDGTHMELDGTPMDLDELICWEWRPCLLA